MRIIYMLITVSIFSHLLYSDSLVSNGRNSNNLDLHDNAKATINNYNYYTVANEIKQKSKKSESPKMMEAKKNLDYARAEAEIHRYDSAAFYAGKAYELDRTNPEFVTAYGNYLSDAGDSVKSFEVLMDRQKLLKLATRDTTLGSYMYALGSAWESRGEYDKALEYYKGAINCRASSVPDNDPKLKVYWDSYNDSMEKKIVVRARTSHL